MTAVLLVATATVSVPIRWCHVEGIRHGSYARDGILIEAPGLASQSCRPWERLRCSHTKVLFWTTAVLVFVVATSAALRRWADRGLFESDVVFDDLTREQFDGYLAAFYRSRGEGRLPRRRHR